jgi:hypothetical protein
MSIYASLPAPSDDAHEPMCARWEIRGPGHYALGKRWCNCGQPDAPLVYKGSHILPADTDPRGGGVDVAMIPGHVRYWRDHPDAIEEPGGPPEPYLRLGVNGETVVLTRRNVAQLYDTLTEWLEETAG